MTDLPEPLTPLDCDLRTYEWMPLDVNRLLTSETWILGTADEKVAALTLWCESWRQVPAASLPDDDRMLAHLSRAGSAWKKVREAVMRSWVKCSDGRLYHPVVAEKARFSWGEKQAQRARTEAARLAKANKKNAHIVSETPPQPPVTKSVTEIATDSVTQSATDPVTEDVTASNRTEQNRTKEERKKDSEATPLATADAAPLVPIDARTEIWREGLAILRRLTGKAEGTSRGFMGRFVKALSDDCAAGMAILHEAEDLRPGEPEAWLMAAANSRSRRAETGISARKERILRAGGLWPADGTTIDHEPNRQELLQ